MRWPGIEQIYGPHLKKTSVFSSPKLWEDLHTRVIEHVGAYTVQMRKDDSDTLIEYPDCIPILHAYHAHATSLASRPHPTTN